MFAQSHIVGGERRSNFTFQIGVIHVTLEIKMASMCYLACDLHPGCAGFDWDIEGATCWFHTEGRECGKTIEYVGGAIAHYRLEACGKQNCFGVCFVDGHFFILPTTVCCAHLCLPL